MEGESAVFQQILSAGVDWITPDVLKVIAHKGEALLKEGKVTELPAASAYDTLIIPSKSKPTKPHIIVMYPNGKVEFQDYRGYSASYLCARAVAASSRRGILEAYLKWLVANKRKTGLTTAKPSPLECQLEEAGREKDNQEADAANKQPVR